MIKVLNYTQKPISFMGKCAGECWNSNTESQDKNLRRGIECLESNHGRVFEYADVTLQITGYSARVIRELYTHILGVTRLQQSTRYVNCSEFEYYTPKSIENSEYAKTVYDYAMRIISEAYVDLLECGIPKEDAANLLPLGMNTTIVLKINLRALIHMFEVRTCNRVYAEFREIMKELKTELSKLDNEWQYLCKNYFKTICDKNGYCYEKNTCGRYARKGD